MDSGIVLQMTASNISIQANLPVTFGILPNKLWVSLLFHPERMTDIVSDNINVILYIGQHPYYFTTSYFLRRSVWKKLRLSADKT